MIDREEGDEVGYPVEWEEIGVEQGERSKTRATQAKRAKEEESHRPEPASRSSLSPFRPPLVRIMIYGRLLLSKPFRLPVT